MKKIILVIGGTGMLGQPVSLCLKEAGFQVRIMTRDLQKARKTFDNSSEIFAGDPMDTSCLEEALNGCCYGVHISLPTEVEQQVAETVSRTASRHGVERITYISGATVAEENRWFPMINRKFLAEQAIREAGIPYTIFCPTWFMESLPRFVVQGRASVLDKQPHPYHWVAAEDYARMVSMAYGHDAAANKRFLVLGPEAHLGAAAGPQCVASSWGRHPRRSPARGLPVQLYLPLRRHKLHQLLRLCTTCGEFRAATLYRRKTVPVFRSRLVA